MVSRSISSRAEPRIQTVMLALEGLSSERRESLTLGKVSVGVEVASQLAMALGKRLSELLGESE